MNVFTSEEAEKRVLKGAGGLGIHGYRSQRVNTRKSPKAETEIRLIAALTAHCERHPKDGQSVSRLDRLACPTLRPAPVRPTEL